VNVDARKTSMMPCVIGASLGTKIVLMWLALPNAVTSRNVSVTVTVLMYVIGVLREEEEMVVVPARSARLYVVPY
jgi:Na+/phosphate symporter